MLFNNVNTSFLHLSSFVFLLFFTFPSISSSNHIPTLPSDALALLRFKSKADLHNRLWFNTSSSHCTWTGVQCDAAAHRVVRFVLEDFTLAGVFAANSLTRLDQLRVLSLQNDSLYGPIPDLSGLLNLKIVFLDHNSFSGAFPPSISSLHRLRTLDLSYNNLTGPLPTWLTQRDRLTSLNLQFNRFNGSIPPFNQSSLSAFNVSGNNLSGPIPVTPVLVKFGPKSYVLNPKLCGEIVHRECRPKIPFFGPALAAGPSAEPPLLPPKAGLMQNADLQGMQLTKRDDGRRQKTIVIIGLSIGVLVLVVSFLCIVLAIKQHRGDPMEKKMNGVGGGGGDIAAAVAEVMRTEEEREEKVKTVAQGIKASKSGALLFCAGEAQLYSVDQLMRASAELLGRGTLGTTYKAVLDNRLIVCVKRLDATKIAGAGKEGFERHMGSVGGLRHPNLVPLRAYFQEKEERLLVYDYQPNGSLFSLIHGSKSARAKPLHWTSCLKIAEDVAQGLSYIHQAWRLVHGNLKSSNVLLGSDFEACVTDYCLTALADDSTLNNDDPDSSGYKAPEVRASVHEATSKSDVYAFGVLLLELLTGKPPAQHPYLASKDIVKWVQNTREVAADDGGEEENRLAMLLEVAVGCSVTSPEQRPTMWQVLKMLQEIKEAVLLEDSDVDPSHSDVP